MGSRGQGNASSCYGKEEGRVSSEQMTAKKELRPVVKLARPQLLNQEDYKSLG